MRRKWRKSGFFEIDNISSARNNLAYMSSNGFTLRLREDKNVLLVQKDNRIREERDNPNAHYNLMAPDDSCARDKGEDWLSYEEGKKLLEERATKYQAEQLAAFNAGIKN